MNIKQRSRRQKSRPDLSTCGVRLYAGGCVGTCDFFAHLLRLSWKELSRCMPMCCFAAEGVGAQGAGSSGHGMVRITALSTRNLAFTIFRFPRFVAVKSGKRYNTEIQLSSLTHVSVLFRFYVCRGLRTSKRACGLQPLLSATDLTLFTRSSHLLFAVLAQSKPGGTLHTASTSPGVTVNRLATTSPSLHLTS